MELNGLKALFLGDSITEGNGASSVEKTYWNVLGKRTGMETVGYGVGGTRIARQTHPSELAFFDQDFNQRAEQMEKQADIIGVLGGTNDYGHGDALIGTPEDTEVDTFYGALNHLYTYLMTAYPNAFIFVMTPTHRIGEGAKPACGFHPAKPSLKRYAEIIREVAEKYSLPVLDLYRESGINPIIPVLRERYMPDGLHPNDAGYEKLSYIVENFLRTHYHR